MDRQQVVGWQAAVTVVLLPHKLLLLLKTTGQRWAGRPSAASLNPQLMSPLFVHQHATKKQKTKAFSAEVKYPSAVSRHRYSMLNLFFSLCVLYFLSILKFLLNHVRVPPLVFLSAPGIKINAASASSYFTGLPAGSMQTHSHTYTQTHLGLKALSCLHRCLLICVIYSAVLR